MKPLRFMRGIFFIISFITRYFYAQDESMQPHNFIYKIRDTAALKPFFNNNNDRALVIFDIDDTLIRVCDYQASGAWYKETYEELIARGKSAEEAKFILFQTHISALYRTPIELINKNMPEYIDLLYKNNVDVICLTAREGRCLLYATLRHLGDAHISLIPNKDSLKKVLFFPEMPEYDVIYSSGILFTGGADKGKVLELFFKKTDYLPTHIIFVDDSFFNVESVSECAKRLGIPFDGFHLTDIEIEKEVHPTFEISLLEKTFIRPQEPS